MGQVGGGTYGDVFKARDRETGEIVALKKVRLEDEKEGFPVTALREIKFLSQVDYENIVKLKEVVSSKASDATRGKGSVYMVFEYAECDLVGLMKTTQLGDAHIKCLLKQLLKAVHFSHCNAVLHRDIKPSNILVNAEGVLKLADWGLCRKCVPGGKYTNRVVTLWYRAPELLLGQQQYTDAVDLWSVGCVMAELLIGRALFPGKDEAEQLKLILDLTGTPPADKAEWPPGWDELPLANELLTRQMPSQMELRFAFLLQPKAKDLIFRLLALDPTKRITAAQALDHDYFWSTPMPCEPKQIPVPKGDGMHEYQVKEEAARKQQMQQQMHHNDHGHSEKRWKQGGGGGKH
jgi:cyclin-dependent kinase 12/13